MRSGLSFDGSLAHCRRSCISSAEFCILNMLPLDGASFRIVSEGALDHLALQGLHGQG